MRHSFLLIIVSFFFFSSKGQVASPYSEVGIGGRNQSFLFNNFTAGGSGAAIQSRNCINVLNPASLPGLNYTVAEVGVLVERNNYSLNNQNGFASNFDLSGAVLGFPLNQNSGVSFGLTPFSGKQYDYSRNSTAFSGTENTTETYAGMGNVSDLFLMYGYRIKNLSLGVKGQYLFGNLIDETKVRFESEDYLNIREQNFFLVRSFSYELGLQYQLNVFDEDQIVFGLTASPTQSIKALSYKKINDFEITTTLDDDENVVEVERHDTGAEILNTIDDKQDTSFTLGGEYRAGLVYQRPGHFKLGFEYHFINGASTSFQSGTNFYSNASVYRAHAEWIPNIDAAGYNSFWKTMRYQTGLFYGNSPIDLSGLSGISASGNNQMYGMNFGLTIPLSKYKYETERFGSYLNFGVGYYRNGDSNSVQEDVLQIMMGITLNDKWFIQRKFK